MVPAGRVESVVGRVRVGGLGFQSWRGVQDKTKKKAPSVELLQL